MGIVLGLGLMLFRFDTTGAPSVGRRRPPRTRGTAGRHVGYGGAGRQTVGRPGLRR